jgi:hypothetical protein
MNPHLFRMTTVDPNSSNRESPKQDDADPGCPPISLLSFLEAENVRLRQAILELSLDARALREALSRMEGRSDCDHFYRQLPHSADQKVLTLRCAESADNGRFERRSE